MAVLAAKMKEKHLAGIHPFSVAQKGSAIVSAKESLALVTLAAKQTSEHNRIENLTHLVCAYMNMNGIE